MYLSSFISNSLWIRGCHDPDPELFLPDPATDPDPQHWIQVPIWKHCLAHGRIETHLMGVFSSTCSGSASSGSRLWRSSPAGSGGQDSGGPAALARLAYNTLPRPWKSTRDWSFPPTAALAPARGCGVVAAAAPCLLLFLAEDRAKLAPCKVKK